MKTLDGTPIGVNTLSEGWEAGLTIDTNATAKVLAHELGHSCGLKDIYTNITVNGDSTYLLDIPVQRSFMSKDWCAEAPNGGYGPLHHPDMVCRLLMYGKNLPGATDIPKGTIWGVTTNGSKAAVRVGLENMNRQPFHW